MTEGQLPLVINPRKLAEKNVEFTGQLAAKLFIRFEEHELGELSPVDVRLHFFIDEQGYRVIKGSLTASIQMTCQRCLTLVEKSLLANWLLAVVKDEAQADRLPSIYEPYFQTDAKMSLVALIEEELLLSLPPVATHEECKSIKFKQKALVIKEKPNPFDVLKVLKKT